MHKLNNLFHRIFSVSLLSCFCLVMPVLVQAVEYNIDDSYLQSLSVEADDLEYMGHAEKELSASQKVDVEPTAAVVENARVATTDMRNFESILSSEYPYTYQLYKKLKTNQKSQVFEKIKETRKLSLAQKMIIDLYKLSLH